MKVHVNPILCTGYGLCAGECPEIFKLDDWGYAYVVDEEVEPHLSRQAARAAAVCPEHAIVTFDEVSKQ